MFRQHLLSTFSDALKSKETAFATPRPWAMVSTILNAQTGVKAEIRDIASQQNIRDRYSPARKRKTGAAIRVRALA